MSDNEFKAAGWARLGVVERVGYCQFMNNEALVLAEQADPQEAAAYRFLARAWVNLADAIGHEAVATSNAGKENLALPDNVPLPVQGDGDATPDDISVPSSGNPKAMADNIPLPEPRSSNATEALHSAIRQFGEASSRQTRIMIRLTCAILFLTVVMLFSIAVQIWLDKRF